MDEIGRFISTGPSGHNFFRGVVLFGANTASYKFALASSLLELADGKRETVSLADLAVPYAAHLCDHLRAVDKQGTFTKSKFLDACREYNAGERDSEYLRSATVRLGFNNVIDAFHRLPGGELPIRFYLDERRAKTQGIRLTDELQTVAALNRRQALAEVEAR